MSITIKSILSALAVMLLAVPTAQGQIHDHFTFPEVESDFQFFSPAEFDEFSGGPPIRTGWFGAYDRFYMSFSRPEDADSFNRPDTLGDFGWGNRYEVGFVEESGRGWSVTGWDMGGPNHFDRFRVERINRFNTNGAPSNPDTGNTDNIPQDNNLRYTAARDYILLNSVNVISMSGFEINRTFYSGALVSGMHLSPVMGFRYMKVRDFFRRENYQLFDAAGNPVPVIPNAPTATIEQFNSLHSVYHNDLVGGQLGLAWNHEYRRWGFSGDAKALVFQNFQNLTSTTDTVTTFYAAAPNGNGADNVNDEVRQRTGFGANGSEFVLGAEVRAEAAYRVTRDFSLRFGFEFLHLAQGIGRGNRPDLNEQDLTAYGFSFGATLNR